MIERARSAIELCVDGGLEKAYKRDPFEAGVFWGWLIEVVERGKKGCAGGGAGRRAFVYLASVLVALDWIHLLVGPG